MAGTSESDNWTDKDEAESLQSKIDDGCSEYNDNPAALAKCKLNDYAGCRWSKLYLLNGITCILIAINCIFAIIGAFVFKCRAVSSCFGSLLCCLTTAAIVTTGVFRFNTYGKLAALSLTPTKYNGEAFVLGKPAEVSYPADDDRTYSTDADMILITWIFMIVFCCTSCCHGGYAQKPTAP